MGKNIKTTRKDIVKYWTSHQDECGLSIDWAEGEERCWRCACKVTKEENLQRCHIIPRALGGEDTPSNLVLLCKRCHAEGPNVTDPEVMWDWIRSYGVAFYDMFWTHMALKEYYFMYGYRYSDEVKEIIKHSKCNDEEKAMILLTKISKNMYNNANIHYGQDYYNTATIAGILRMTIKEFSEKLGVNLSDIEEEKVDVWWTKY